MVTDETICFSVHGGVDRKRLVFVYGGRAQQDTRAAAATSESGLGPGSTLTGISSHFGAKLRDWAVRQAGAGCYSWAALSSNDSKTRYRVRLQIRF